MEIKMFYKTQRELADVINKLIDSYWTGDIKEEFLINQISGLYNNNPSKFMKNSDFTTIIKQQCGKRRLEVVERILKISQK
ncbi:TIGR04540 family protein [Acetivibrio cellulolyticus]|uniref:TIGR04540 family protein n=1 Tax=Acetivibrio cellulolyticus TaxID=35830 RepID=UPI0001E30174|nr:TIGR04540 family protein [Acetivibrio cellulolyticus]